SSLFPGGSITGAPKKRVMKILNSIEHSSRQFYCGSTFLNYGGVRSASINIRSAMIDVTTKKLTYHAGGGITVKSSVEGEYEEMLSKVQSFTGLFNPESRPPLNKKTKDISALSI
ncbi:chorismate-binding protein, partial [Bacteriovoracaceae bacterium]|nr:chorismate-binding protein [Bacteriovoracaceae bacterium]